MENFDFIDTLTDGPAPLRGFSRAQILQLSSKDIEDLHVLEYPEALGRDQDRGRTEKKENPDGGPRPPREDDFPDEEKEELFSEVSDPEKED